MGDNSKDIDRFSNLLIIPIDRLAFVAIYFCFSLSLTIFRTWLKPLSGKSFKSCNANLIASDNACEIILNIYLMWNL